MAPSLRDLKIKTGVLKRTSKELEMYKKEAIQQQAVIDKLVADAKDIHDIRKQKEVLEETTQMIPDCENRLQAAHRELALQIEEIQGDEKLLESEEAKAAIALIQELGL